MQNRPLAQTALDGYIAQLKRTPEFLLGVMELDPTAAINAEIQKVFLETEFYSDGSMGLMSPAARPNGERILGHHQPGPEWESGSDRPASETYVFVLNSLLHSRAYLGFSVQISIDLSGSGYVWLGECNNSAAYTPQTPEEVWGFWNARNAIPLDDTPYSGPFYMGRTSVQ